MIINFFDRNFEPLTDNNSLVVERYELVQSAVDFDIFKATCEPHDININPFFVTLEDDRGRYVYGAIAGIPQVDANSKTQIIANDVKTLFAGEVIANFTDYPSSGTVKLSSHLTRLWGFFKEQLTQGYYKVDLELKVVNFTDTDIDVRIIKRDEKYIANLWNLFAEVLIHGGKIDNKDVGYFMDSRIDLVGKRIVYRIADNNKFSKALQLSDYGLKDFTKFVAPINEVVATDESFENQRRWFLTSDNKLTQVDEERDIFPIKRKVFVNEKINTAEAEAILALAENKYQENITIPFNKAVSPSEFYFDTLLDIWPKPVYTADGKRDERYKYKSLPVGAIGIIEGKGTNSYWLEIGYRPKQPELLLRKILGGTK